MRSGWRGIGAAAVLSSALAMTVAGCSGGDSTSAGTELGGTSWLLASYTASGAETPAVAGADGAPLTFAADGSLSGSTGCNRFTGTYTQDGNDLTISLGAMTEMACAGPVGDQEAAVLAAMPLVRTADTSAGLVLKAESGDVLLTYSAALTDLAGTAWQATGINNGVGGVESNAVTPSVTAVFGEDETLSGSGGCNTYNATYTSGEDGEIVIGPIAATKMACPDDAMQVEQQYFAALEKATTYTIEGTTLTLRDDSGAMQVSYRLTP